MACSIEDCQNPLGNAGLCWSHYERRRKYGSATARRTGTCSQCGSEFDCTNRTGPTGKYCGDACRRDAKRAPDGTPDGKCLACGAPARRGLHGRTLKYCRPECRELFHRHNGSRPRTRTCGCGAEIDLTERMADGRIRRPAYTLRCDACMATSRPHRYGMTAAEVAARDGTKCRWCGDDVDMTLAGSRNKRAPSVDHVVAWSRGGTNDPSNLQLMHRDCNAVKGTRNMLSEQSKDSSEGVFANTPSRT